MPIYGLQRSLLDGLSMTFLTLLSGATAPAVEALISAHVLKGVRMAELCRAPPAPSGSHVLFEQYWVESGPLPLPEEDAVDPFVLTPSVRRHLATLARAVLLRRHPILLQARVPARPAPRPSARKTASFLELIARLRAALMSNMISPIEYEQRRPGPPQARAPR
jgi:midasin (ATPase involved in ribosome maturation)